MVSQWVHGRIPIQNAVRCLICRRPWSMRWNHFVTCSTHHVLWRYSYLGPSSSWSPARQVGCWLFFVVRGFCSYLNYEDQPRLFCWSTDAYAVPVDKANMQVALCLSNWVISSLVLAFESGHLRSFRDNRWNRFDLFVALSGIVPLSAVLLIADVDVRRPALPASMDFACFSNPRRITLISLRVFWHSSM
jgi:hypothetical protein